MSFLATVAGAGLASTATARMGPGGQVWIAVSVAPKRAVPLALAAHGLPFAGHGAGHSSGDKRGNGDDEGWLWWATRPDGETVMTDPNIAAYANTTSAIALVTGAVVRSLDDAAWPACDLRHLLAATSLTPSPLRGQREILLFVPSALTQWVLDRALALELDVNFAPCDRWPLLADAGAQPQPGICMQMHHRDAFAPTQAQVPASWLRALCDLPGVVVAQPIAGLRESARYLWIDVRCRLPVAASLLDALLPSTEISILGAADVGHSRLRLASDLVPAQSLIAPPAMAVPATAADLGPRTEIAKIPVTIVGSRSRAYASAMTGARTTDAVLADDAELAWLRDYLMALPIGERVYTIPGDGAHLLIAAGGESHALPFGLPLSRIGPGALYLEQGAALSPPLPAAARAQAFAATPDTVVILTREHALRFNFQALVPAWTLWLGPAPNIQPSAMPDDQQASLQAMAHKLMPHGPDARRAIVGRGPLPRPAGTRSNTASADTAGADGDELGPAALRDQAAADLLRGEVSAAARKLEAAGDMDAAARLYERAAAVTLPATSS